MSSRISPIFPIMAVVTITSLVPWLASSAQRALVRWVPNYLEEWDSLPRLLPHLLHLSRILACKLEHLHILPKHHHPLPMLISLYHHLAPLALAPEWEVLGSWRWEGQRAWQRELWLWAGHRACSTIIMTKAEHPLLPEEAVVPCHLSSAVSHIQDLV